MCDPTTLAIATLAISSTGAVAGYQAQSAQAKVQTAMHERNVEEATKATVRQYTDVQNRQQQEIAAASQAIEKRRREQMQQEARARVAAGEAGVFGLSVDRVLQDIAGAGSRDVATIQQNLDWNVTNLQNQLLGIQSQGQSRINSTTPGQKPSPWAAAFKIGEGAVSAGSTYLAAGGDPMKLWGKG